MLALRRVRYGMVLLAVLVIGWLLWKSLGALFPFIVGAILAYLLAPVVERIARFFPFYRSHRERARIIAILIVYLAGAALLIEAGVLIVPAIIDEVDQFVEKLPAYVEQSQVRGQEWTDRYRDRVPANMQVQVDEYVAGLGQMVSGFAQRMVSRTFGVVVNTFNLVIGFVVIPFWLFYVLKDRHSLGPAIKAWFPPRMRKDVDECIRIFQHILGSYIRAQLTLGIFIGIVTTIGLFLLDVQFYYILGIIAGVTELIPVIGPIIGAVPALIVVLATSPEKFWPVLIFYVAVQQIENAVLVPRLHGQATELHPAMIIVLLVIAQQVAGFAGMIVVVPLAAVSRDLFRYIYQRLKQEEGVIEEEEMVPR